MRLLLCPTCAAAAHHQAQHPEDAAMDFRWRRVEIKRVRTPAVHRITINGKAQPALTTLICDRCSAPILDGSPAVAVTQWRSGEMGPWENEYSQ